MARFTLPRYLLALGTALALAAPAAIAQNPPALLPEQLKLPIKFSGFDADPKMTLQEALDHFADRYGVLFDVNEAAFKEDKIDDVLSSAICVKSLPKMSDVPFERVLRKVLARVPAASGTTFLVRGNIVEITTVARARAEVWGEDYTGPYLPLVHATLDRRPLGDALKDLTEECGFPIVLDARVADKAKTAVTAKLANTPVDRAVLLLADMTDLDSVLLGNMLYVTTKENAEHLRAREKEHHRAATMPRADDSPAGGP